MSVLGRGSELGLLRSAGILVFVHFVAHFVPFERQGLAPDDYAFLADLRSSADTAALVRASPDRPVTQVARALLGRVVGLDGTLQVLVVWLASTVLALAVLVLLRELLGDGRAGLLGALLWTLLPAHAELYHYLVHAHISLCYAAYAMAVWALLRFLRGGSPWLLMACYAAYTAGAFWYEVGLLFPLLALALAVLYPRRGGVAAALGLMLPAAGYLAWRAAASSGAADAWARTPALDRLVPNLLLALPGHYVGRYAARGFVYGLAALPGIPLPWTPALLVADAVLLVVAVRWHRPWTAPDRRALAAAAALVLAFALPACFWAVESRHTALSSIGVAVLVLGAAARLGAKGPAVLLGALGAALLSAQGAAWNQAVAARISAALFETLREDRARLEAASFAILDARSFAERIPYSWGDRQANVLHYFWGQQVLHANGFQGMVRLLLPGRRPRTLVAVTRPEERKGWLVFLVAPVPHPVRPSPSRPARVPSAQAYVLDYARVFGEGFAEGRRRGSAPR